MSVGTVSAPRLGISHPAIKREARRQFVVRAVFFIFLLSLIEGALRKWFLPGLAGPLTLLRDPFVLFLYAYCFVFRLIWLGGIAQFWLLFSAITVILGALQYTLNGFGVAGWMLGMRTYWLYMPLAFIVARVFHYDDVLRFIKMVLWIALPYSFLVAAQYNAPQSAMINWGVSGDAEGSLKLSAGIVRPFGLFTFTSPNVRFTALVISFFIAFYLSRRVKLSDQLLLIISVFTVGSMAVLTGSRSIYFNAASIIFLTLFGLFFVRLTKKSSIKAVMILGFVVVSGLLMVLAFPDMLVAMQLRIERASTVEGSLWNRVYYSGFSFIEAYDTAPFWGHGIGLGAPGIAGFLGLPALHLGEGDTMRNVNELGLLFGSIFLALRWYTGFWLMRCAIRLAGKGVYLTLPLTGLVLFPMSVAQLTNSPLSGFPAWLVIGLILAVHVSIKRRDKLSQSRQVQAKVAHTGMQGH